MKYVINRFKNSLTSIVFTKIVQLLIFFVANKISKYCLIYKTGKQFHQMQDHQICKF